MWGQRVQELGVGPAPIPMALVTKESLAPALRLLVEDETMRTRARELGSAVRQENGVRAGVEAVISAIGRT